MVKYFSIQRLKQAVEHLQCYDSKWVLVPLVFAVNNVGTDGETRVQGDRFFNKYFNGELIGLPKFETGNSLLRPRFAEIAGQLNSPNDYVLYQDTKLWANLYSSRGYREMKQSGYVAGGKGKFKLIEPRFSEEWHRGLSTDFRFEELLVWLYGFSGVADEVNTWELLFQDFQESNLESEKTFLPLYLTRFKVDDNVTWDDSFLIERPSYEEYQHSLIPSWSRDKPRHTSPKQFSPDVLDDEIASEGDPESLYQIVQKFSSALINSGLNFGNRHEEIVRTVLVSLITKPLVILTGLSGSGKTQIVLKLGQWFGEDRWVLVPVRPDWTGGESIFGFEDALDQNSNRAWFVPDVLQFVLHAARNSDFPHLLILDEMNLAHVERYFGDFLSGLESRTAVLPNLFQGEDGRWRLQEGEPIKVPLPSNLFVVGTVNIDETTYMFSPKVLDRANTIEFRVTTEELSDQIRKPNSCTPGDKALVQSFLSFARNDSWHQQYPLNNLSAFTEKVRDIHRILARGGFEFGHRVFYEMMRYAAFYEAASSPDAISESVWKEALDFQVVQKVLPRLHGSQKRLGSTLRSIASFCFFLEPVADKIIAETFNPEDVNQEEAQLKQSFNKLNRMYTNMRSYQFTSFTE
jgi:MoxR-like ATPase